MQKEAYYGRTIPYTECAISLGTMQFSYLYYVNQFFFQLFCILCRIGLRAPLLFT